VGKQRGKGTYWGALRLAERWDRLGLGGVGGHGAAEPVALEEEGGLPSQDQSKCSTPRPSAKSENNQRIPKHSVFGGSAPSFVES
jgi:hypothetical protein